MATTKKTTKKTTAKKPVAKKTTTKKATAKTTTTTSKRWTESQISTFILAILLKASSITFSILFISCYCFICLLYFI